MCYNRTYNYKPEMKQSRIKVINTLVIKNIYVDYDDDMMKMMAIIMAKIVTMSEIIYYNDEKSNDKGSPSPMIVIITMKTMVMVNTIILT